MDALRGRMPLSVDREWRRGEPRSRRGEMHSTSGFSLVVSEADFDAFEAQVADAAEFLRKHLGAIAEVAAFEGVDHAVLDFGALIGGDTVAVFREFPPALVRLAADAGISLCVSCYLCSTSEDDEA